MIGQDVLAELGEILEDAQRRDRRYLLGVVGVPGAGKSAAAAFIQRSLGIEQCAVVPQDGFHLATALIAGTEAAGRRGAWDTFDSAGFVSLLLRLRLRQEPAVYIPQFDRGLEDPVWATSVIRREQLFVIVEGNYLLADDASWGSVRELLDAVWLVTRPHDVRVRDLTLRHMQAGKTASEARKWALGSDAINARYVERFALRADRVLELAPAATT